MVQLTYPITHIDKSRASLSLSKTLYSAEAIHASAYKYSGEYFVYLSEREDRYEILFERKNEESIDDVTIKNICNDLIDQQIRVETENRFGHIRNLIVEEAFKPVTK
ncbi:MAG: His-Xaa-Ser system protein HxsD [Bacteroides sp.]|nr:His-Xaa-Ser system protein HxsD [Bacteroides sp.]MBD5328075.1 His-Xaa-Ser system protein HxsD [Bacteroides sp.]